MVANSLRMAAAALLTLGALSGCATRPGPEALEPVAAPAETRLLRILVATNREREQPDANVFTNRRAITLNFAEFTFAVPVNEARLQLAGAAPKTFPVVEQHILTPAAFKSRLASLQQTKRKREVTVFVHGFNNNFQEALFRLVQVTADTGVETPHILFAWPSRASVTGYLADREAVTYSRDYLSALLVELASDSSVGKIRLAAHSMGAWLAMESIRGLRFTGRDDVVRKLDVILAAPDIDVDVFSEQLRVIGPLHPPMKLLVSKNDDALRISGILAENRRVGSIDVEDPRVKEAVLRAKIQVIDISNITSPDGTGHDRFVYLAALYPQLARRPALSEAGVFLLDAAGAVVRTPLDAGLMVSGAD